MLSFAGCARHVFVGGAVVGAVAGGRRQGSEGAPSSERGDTLLVPLGGGRGGGEMRLRKRGRAGLGGTCIVGRQLRRGLLFACRWAARLRAAG